MASTVRVSCRRRWLQLMMNRRRMCFLALFAGMATLFVYTHYMVSHVERQYFKKSQSSDQDSNIVVVAVEYDYTDDYLNDYKGPDDDNNNYLPDVPLRLTSKPGSLAGWAPESVPTTAASGARNTLPYQIPARLWNYTPTDTALNPGTNPELLLRRGSAVSGGSNFSAEKPGGYQRFVLSKPPPTVNETSSAEDWSAVQTARRKLMRRKCEEYLLLPRISPYDTRSITHLGKDFLYCPVEKAASTFMRRFMFGLVHSDSYSNVPSPFDIPINSALSYNFDSLRTLFRMGIYDFPSRSFKFLLVREPFSRLYASYIDKLFLPNTYYWKKWAAPAISRFRRGSHPPPLSLQCGHDVTFAEFVKIVIFSLHHTDEHVKPMRLLCSPCDLEFSMIGHVETLTEDFRHLIEHLNVSLANFTFETLPDEMARDSILDSTYSSFTFQQDLEKCVSKYEMGQRLWKQMQIKGIIDGDLDFPLSEKLMTSITAHGFAQLLESARKMSRDREKLQQQRHEALVAAYKLVSPQDISKLIKIYSLDFEMFGYPKHPDFLP